MTNAYTSAAVGTGAPSSQCPPAASRNARNESPCGLTRFRAPDKTSDASESFATDHSTGCCDKVARTHRPCQNESRRASPTTVNSSNPCRSINPSAIASILLTAITGTPPGSANACAANKLTRKPEYAPGPRPTTYNPNSPHDQPASASKTRNRSNNPS